MPCCRVGSPLSRAFKPGCERSARSNALFRVVACQVATRAAAHGEAMGAPNAIPSARRRFSHGKRSTHEAHLPYPCRAILAASVVVMLFFLLASTALAA